MTLPSIVSRAAALAVAGLMLLVQPVAAAELQVVSSGGFAAAYRALAPDYERASGDRLSIHWGPSMGDTPNAVPARLARGEKLDVVIMVGYALDDLIKQGKVLPDSKVVLARSSIGVAVKAGAPKPDIGSAEAVKRALLAAKSIAYSDSASGVYISTRMFQRLGIAEQMEGKARKIPATPVGEIVAKGEAELGFQQIAELKAVEGIDLVGPLPPELQQVTLYSAGIVAGSHDPAAAKKLLDFLASPAAAPVIAATGLEPTATGQ
ncbi:substrate-binding domain-containing protein [Inquilinus sp. Marseille-Q2685]|uniref:substrate-binding domain-containing protein n=1 Tax=Inquilinus sp. Marseille-Q2685 TaxID=2866581 RepID=UPI001CE4AFE8|nr:substrate-binding domain-containing protein [Inquilinus sp. Marseille-Q2685]